MDKNRDSAHYSQNEEKFPTFSLGLEFLNEAEKETKQWKRRLGISAVMIRFTVRGWKFLQEDTNDKWQTGMCQPLKVSLNFSVWKLLNIKLELSAEELK